MRYVLQSSVWRDSLKDPRTIYDYLNWNCAFSNMRNRIHFNGALLMSSVGSSNQNLMQCTESAVLDVKKVKLSMDGYI